LTHTERRGFVASIDVRAVGLAVVELGGGRSRAADEVDPAVGLTELARIGAEVGRPCAARPRACAERGQGRRRRSPPPRRYRLDEAPLSPATPGDRTHCRHAVVSVLIAITGWDPKPWRQRMKALLPSHKIVMLDESFDRESVRYALSWRHPQGALKDLPNLRVILSLGAGVDHLFADPALPDKPIVRVVDPDLTNRMSEWVVMHALVHLRQLRRYERQQSERVWRDDDQQPKASDIQIGVLGLGVMGKDAVGQAEGAGFKVAGWSASPKPLSDMTCFSGADGLKRHAGANRHARRVAAADRSERAASSTRRFYRSSSKAARSRPDPDQRRTRRTAGRSRHPGPLIRAHQRRLLSMCSSTSRCRRIRACGASCGLHQSAQCGDLIAPGDRRVRRPADRGFTNEASRLPMWSIAAVATKTRRQAH